MTSEIKVGIIGYGGIGKLHAKALSNVPGVRLVAIADSNASLLEGVDRDILRFADHGGLLTQDLDAVLVCSPTRWHASASLEALAQGKHVLVEKPMATTAADGEAMCRLASERGLVLMVGMTHRFYPEVREAKQRVEEGAIGDVLMCRDTVLEGGGEQSLPSWYLDKTMAGGGVAMSNGIHLIDRLRWFSGQEVRQVAGSKDNRYFGKAVEDAAQMFLWFDKGVTASATMAFVRGPHPLVCDLEVVGTKGSIVVHTWQGYTLHGHLGSKNHAIYQSEPHGYKVQIGLERELKEFAAAIREGRKPSPSPEDSLKALEVVEAFYAAAHTNSVVALPYQGRTA
jgi:UDP-N-acetylglucosamine 3-dehydrogenase